MPSVTFLHPDLGIGGAERLIVDAAVALKASEYDVHILTTHHSSSHCFNETKDGTLPVTVVGDWLPRNIFGYCYALCSYIRMIYAALYLVLFSDIKTDIVFCDQVSVQIPILRLFISHVIFYCHFPDQLLHHHSGLLTKVYRIPIDYLEEKTTACADTIIVNSIFTKNVFKNTFQSIQTNPIVLYPSVNLKNKVDESLIQYEKTFLSINRYERKKHISILLEAFNALKSKLTDEQWVDVKLIIAGGYDPLVKENIEYYNELTTLAKKLQIHENVEFLKSPNDKKKLELLQKCLCVIYTPPNEHFGIVPLEAMYCKKVVIAVNSGGPTETIINDETGFLCPLNPDDFADAMFKCYDNIELAKKLGNAAKDRFNDCFSFNAFSQQLSNLMNEIINTKHV